MRDKMIPGHMNKDNNNLSYYRVFKHQEVSVITHGCSPYYNMFDLFDFIPGLCV